MTAPVIVVFGAAVRANGAPSPTLARRIGYAAHTAREHPAAPIFCSGGVGAVGPSEASVIAEVLQASGIDRNRLHLDEKSTDTLESVIATAHFVRREQLNACIACSDRYHLPRIRLLLSMLGISMIERPTVGGRDGTPLAYWWKMRLREGFAIPYDAAVLLARRKLVLSNLPTLRT